MKKLMIIFALAAMLAGCGGETINGVNYDSYGIVNEDSTKNPNIRYEISIFSVIMGVVFIESIIVPIYIIGWDLWIPIGPKEVDPNMKGVIK